MVVNATITFDLVDDNENLTTAITKALYDSINTDTGKILKKLGLNTTSVKVEVGTSSSY